MSLPADYHRAAAGTWQRHDDDTYCTWLRDTETWLLPVQGDPHFVVPLQPLGVAEPLRVIALVRALDAEHPDRTHQVMETEQGFVLLTPAPVPADDTDLTLSAARFTIGILAALERGI